MKTQIHEVKRMQQLAGVINESQLNEISIGQKNVISVLYFFIIKKYIVI